MVDKRNFEESVFDKEHTNVDWPGRTACHQCSYAGLRASPRLPVKSNLCLYRKLSAMFFCSPNCLFKGWWANKCSRLDGLSENLAIFRRLRHTCAFCFLDLVKWALAIGISARRKKTRTMTRSLVVLSVIFILTKCRWEDDVLNFFRTCKQKMRRSESQGPKSQKVFLRGRVLVGMMIDPINMM